VRLQEARQQLQHLPHPLANGGILEITTRRAKAVLLVFWVRGVGYVV